MMLLMKNVFIYYIYEIYIFLILDHSVKEMDHQAIKVLSRIHSKLTGTDFPNHQLDVQQQVDRLIEEATSPVNLCQSYIGWCPFW